MPVHNALTFRMRVQTQATAFAVMPLREVRGCCLIARNYATEASRPFSCSSDPRFGKMSVAVDVRELFLQRLDLGPVVDHDVELIRVVLRVILVVLLGRVESAQLSELRHDWARKSLRGGELLDVALCNLLLLRVPVENRRTVLSAVIRPLAIELGWIVCH